MSEFEQDHFRIKRVGVSLVILAVLIILGGVNRLADFAFLKERVGDGMRLWETLDLLVLGPLAVVVIWKLFAVFETRNQSSNTIILVLGLFVFATGAGAHAVTNSLHVQFRPFLNPDLGRAIIHLDDELSHWIYFTGFLMISFAMASAEIDSPLNAPLSWKVAVLPVCVGLSTAAVIYKNMVNENTAMDVTVIAATVVVIAVRHLIKGSESLRKLPVVLAIYLAFGLGALSTLIVWLIR